MRNDTTPSFPLDSVASFKIAALEYLEYLDYHFRPALNYSVDDYEIISGLNYSELFPVSIIEIGEYRDASIRIYHEVVNNLKIQLDSGDSIEFVLHNSWVESLVGPEWTVPDEDFENDFEYAYIDLRVRLINALVACYFKKIVSLVAELIKNNRKEFWWLAFYVKGSPGIAKFIEEIDSNRKGRSTMNYYLQCLIDYKARVAHWKGTQFCVSIKFPSSCDGLKWQPWLDIEAIDLDEVFKCLVEKLERYYKKLTVKIPEALLKTMFVKLGGGKSPSLVVYRLSNLIKSEFHCSDSVWDKRFYKYLVAKVKASDLFCFARFLVDQGIIVEATKDDLGLLLRYKFYGVVGFSESSQDTYLTKRKTFKRRSKDYRLEKEMSVTARFEAKYPDLLNGYIFYTPRIFQVEKSRVRSIKTAFEKFLLHSN